MLESKLIDVPETMRWTLHHRAKEAMREDTIINDDKAIEIYKTINYYYDKDLAKPNLICSRTFLYFSLNS